MTSGRTARIALSLLFVFGLALSAAATWSLQVWSEQRALSDRKLAAEAWAYRVSKSLQTANTSFQLSATVFSELDRIEPSVFNNVMNGMLETTSVSSVAWAFEITQETLALSEARKASATESNPPEVSPPQSPAPDRLERAGIPVELLQFVRPDLRQELRERPRVFLIGLNAGDTKYLQLGLELLEQPTLEPAVVKALESASSTPVVVEDGESASTQRLLLLVPLVVLEGEGLGILLAEVRLDHILEETRSERSKGFRLALFGQYPPLPDVQPIWSSLNDESEPGRELLTELPVQLGQERWTLRVTNPAPKRVLAPEAAVAGLVGLLFTLTLSGYGQLLLSRIERRAQTADQTRVDLESRELDYRNSLQKLKHAEERYRDLFEKSQALIWTQDEEGQLISINPAAAVSLGYALEEMQGRPLRDFVIPTERHTFPNYVEKSRTQDTSKGLLKLYTKNGATRFWMYQTSRLVEGDTVLIRCHALDVTESQQAERELERLSRRNELILDSVGDGIYGINLAGECTFVNPAALKYTGYTREELLKAVQTMHDILQPERSDGTRYLWEDSPSFATLSDGEIRRVNDEVMWRKDGGRFPVEYVVTPIVEDDDRILGAVVTFQDITERRAVEQMKNEFISIVSHELRTPLTSIRGSLGLLASGLLKKFPDKAEKMLKIAVENTDRLVRLINDILDIERLESGKVSIEQVECDLGVLMKNAAETMQSMANDNGVVLVVEPLETSVWADSDRVLQVLTNLLSNSIKFSEPNGEVKLLAGPFDSESSGWVEISVEDQGRGIPPEKLEKIFERFGQVDASDSREKGGTGLGLPICRTIVNQHGGKIWVESTLGQGSAFRFTLPTKRPDPVDDEA